jgi:nucleoid DNA-binding protein
MITDELAKGNRLEFREFGVFETTAGMPTAQIRKHSTGQGSIKTFG